MTDPVIAAARWLAQHVEWMRHRPEADEFLADVAAAARVVEGVARGPSSQRYLGPCGAVLTATAQPCPEGCACQSGPRTALSEACAGCLCFTACHPTVATGAEGEICDGSVYAHDGAARGKCRNCGAGVSTEDRRQWINDEARTWNLRAAHISDAYAINVNTIRSWAARGQLVEHGRDRDQRPLYNVGDVLDLAAADAARRAGNQAKRARRKDNAA